MNRRVLEAVVAAVTITALLAMAPVAGASLSVVTTWGGPGTGQGQFSVPLGVAVDAAGNVYVVDENNDRVEKFDSNGRFLLQFGSPGSGPGQFNGPGHVALDPQGNVIVADEGGYRVEKFAGRRLPAPVRSLRPGTGPVQRKHPRRRGGLRRQCVRGRGRQPRADRQVHGRRWLRHVVAGAGAGRAEPGPALAGLRPLRRALCDRRGRRIHRQVRHRWPLPGAVGAVRKRAAAARRSPGNRHRSAEPRVRRRSPPGDQAVHDDRDLPRTHELDRAAASERQLRRGGRGRRPGRRPVRHRPRQRKAGDPLSPGAPAARVR